MPVWLLPNTSTHKKYTSRCLSAQNREPAAGIASRSRLTPSQRTVTRTVAPCLWRWLAGFCSSACISLVESIRQVASLLKKGIKKTHPEFWKNTVFSFGRALRAWTFLPSSILSASTHSSTNGVSYPDPESISSLRSGADIRKKRNVLEYTTVRTLVLVLYIGMIATSLHSYCTSCIAACHNIHNFNFSNI